MKTKINERNDYLLGLLIKNAVGEELFHYLSFYDLTFEQINAIAERYRKNVCYMVSIYELRAVL